MKPDLVAIKSGVMYVMDVAVTTTKDMQKIWDHKVDKYGSPGCERRMREVLAVHGGNVGTIKHFPVVFTERGILFRKTEKALRSLGVKGSTLSALCFDVVVGSLKIYDTWTQGN